MVIEGLVSDAKAAPGLTINFAGQGTLHLRRVKIGNNNDAGGSSSHAVYFSPVGPAAPLVSDSVFYNAGGKGGTATAGIYIKPASGVTANVSIERSLFEANNFGIIADGTGGGIIRGVVSDSVVASNRNHGITVSTTSSSVVLTVDNTKITGNNFGLAAAGSNAGFLVRRSIIGGNSTGLSAGSGSALISYKDNAVNANTTTDGAFSGTVNTQ